MGSTRVKQGQPRRHLTAGEARRSGAVRVSCSGDQMGGEEHLCVAGSKLRRLVAVVELRVAGNVAGDELCGCRSSGEVKLEATGHGEARGVVLRVPASAVSVLVTVVWQREEEGNPRGCEDKERG